MGKAESLFSREELRLINATVHITVQGLPINDDLMNASTFTGVHIGNGQIITVRHGYALIDHPTGINIKSLFNSKITDRCEVKEHYSDLDLMLIQARELRSFPSVNLGVSSGIEPHSRLQIVSAAEEKGRIHYAYYEGEVPDDVKKRFEQEKDISTFGIMQLLQETPSGNQPLMILDSTSGAGVFHQGQLVGIYLGIEGAEPNAILYARRVEMLQRSMK